MLPANQTTVATTYIVRKNSRNDLGDRPGYAKFARRGGGGSRPGAGPRRAGAGSGGGRPQGGSQGGYRGDSRNRGGGGRGGGRGRNIQEMAIDLSKLINKAVAGVPEEAFKPVHSFADFPVDDRLKANIISKGYLNPTPIQDAAIPEVLKGHDVVGLANTGTGKTATFLIPLIDKVLKYKALGQNHRVLVMVPTRELAIQIEQEYWGFAKQLMMNAVVCVGGAGIEPQIRVLRKAPSFVIGTPGRLKDLEERREINFADFGTVVLDEADRMLDMGFRDDMTFIVGKCSKERQTLFFSATLSPEIKKLTSEFLKDPAFISVVSGETSKNIDQDVVRVKTQGEKLDRLHEILKKDGSDKVLIFREMKHAVDTLTKELSQMGFKVGCIHGDKRSRERIRTLDLFKQDKINILIATDVAARGLDIPDVTHVINYDVPQTYDTYVHRIGRTGRAGKKGTALTFVPA